MGPGLAQQVQPIATPLAEDGGLTGEGDLVTGE